MRIIVTAGPTREYIDAVRFISNASSGRMGCAAATAALEEGHDVTLLAGAICDGLLASAKQSGSKVVPFVSVTDLAEALELHFPDCDALVMAAAVGDFRTETGFPGKLSRGDGPVTLRLFPTEDLLAGLRSRKRSDQVVVAFAVEDGLRAEIEQKARAKLIAKNADYVVVNTTAAIAAKKSFACILSAAGVVLPWAERPKEQLARKIVKLLGAPK